VVAQEVRNLANRSALAAKEIKLLVENATSKADFGKNIATDMINGYKQLNENISNTTKLIFEVENASKEQLSGIEQINHAINQLDQQTQQNARIAFEAKNIAINTDELSKSIVNSTNEKEFEGKIQVKSKNLKSKIVSEDKKVLESKKINEDDWESF